jgi:hypothetical protein
MMQALLLVCVIGVVILALMIWIATLIDWLRKESIADPLFGKRNTKPKSTNHQRHKG